MLKMIAHMGVTLRCYGNVEVEAESVEAALPLLTADFIADNFDVKEVTQDSGQDLAVIDIHDAKTGNLLADYCGHALPSPYDPQPDAELLAALKLELPCVIGTEERTGVGPSPVRQAIEAAISKAEGRANG
ncbi:hypothetical protein P9228_05950 [Mesorhizobium sp. WSM4898]|uniref:hypothetical protein n=1 Tax=Mesorhizobium sp. WSM4898 TaxID=3038544 RepID=UPI002414EAB6|nr:hypothetical protein [Mesorhizobium sp. WSM4898]MDG4905990.1 hypothetical protein [Mesorhizobium sp. WSM4898]